ncbi:hypothetical protein LHGZ1_1239 [Laribacter hongkongensis]|uniref:Uncharacterized protein n=1 Tax=Laribacter hongkongensis TaxID=168471 RepID=A0A248LH25_9NEIS|nr:hypothetical protein LHGZ1_1239 [Laribacter hongkongensis]
MYAFVFFELLCCFFICFYFGLMFLLLFWENVLTCFMIFGF